MTDSVKNPFESLREVREALDGHIVMASMVQTGASPEVVRAAAHAIVDRALDLEEPPITYQDIIQATI